MFLIDRDNVQTMQHIKARAEAWAWITYQAYLDAGKHARDLSRTDRAASLWKAREYKRRAIRVSQRLNAQTPTRCIECGHHRDAHQEEPQVYGRCFRGWGPNADGSGYRRGCECMEFAA